MENNNRFSDGFLMGLLIGGAAVFLLGTKKGNKVLNAITQDGIEGLSDFIDSVDEKEVAENTIKKTGKIVQEAAPVVEENIEEKIRTSPKRFFKKSK